MGKNSDGDTLLIAIAVVWFIVVIIYILRQCFRKPPDRPINNNQVYERPIRSQREPSRDRHPAPPALRVITIHNVGHGCDPLANNPLSRSPESGGVFPGSTYGLPPYFAGPPPPSYDEAVKMQQQPPPRPVATT